MDFYSTRGDGPISGAQAVINGIAKDGGLYVPSSFPPISKEDIEDMIDLDYQERSAYIMSLYLTDFTYEELLEYTKKAYAKFEDQDPSPITKVDEKTYIMELWHGPTLAFKDVALTVLPYLLIGSKQKKGNNSKTLILVATSGDTGKAALEGFKDVEGTEIIVFYPQNGVSDMQKLQMQTTEGNNVNVIGIDGNFDDAQTAVKSVFNNKEIIAKLNEKGYELSSANSINFGRLVPQVVYYISSYVDLVANGEIENGDEINFVVPCGNFGNILAAYYAKRMGIPVKQLIVASNKNNVLTEFFSTGIYDSNRDFYKTMSPSMDILISSNLERLLYEIMDRNPQKIKELMTELKESGYYTIDEEILNNDYSEFLAYFTTEKETLLCIDNFFDEYGYLLDTHTAVAVSAYLKYLNDTLDDDTPTVIVSTANPYKFPQDVYKAVSKSEEQDAQKAVKKLFLATGLEIPKQISELKTKEVLHTTSIAKEDIELAVLNILLEGK
ncbi:MAG: threonine synthase [Clostridiales bacterium]|nr:threonine synthase [Clostridiales bacterium]